MSVQVASNRLIVFSLKRYAGFYQQLINRVSGFQELGNRLVAEAKIAIAFRQTDKLEVIGEILSNLPLEENRLTGQYYLAWCAYRKGSCPRDVFESIVEKSETHRASALISIAALEARKRDYESELRCYIEALKYANNPTMSITALRGIALVKSKEGFNQQSLKNLESLVPMLKYTQPDIYYDCLNSLAVELGEAGRIEEARKVIRIVLASPFAFAYPEWRETSDEIELRGYKSRSVVSLTHRKPENVLYLPERSSISDTTQSGPAPILDYLKWKKKMVKEPNDEGNDKLPDNMSRQDMAMKILEIITQNKEDESKLRKLLDYTVELFSGPKKSDK